MFRKARLDNGIPVVMEQLVNFRSFIVGVWVKVGSRNEIPSKNGISHFLEHMFFKGTEKRSPSDIAFHIDSLGGDLNAFTSRENTAFYVKVLDEYKDSAIELLADIFLNSRFPEDEIEKEKGVIKEEIKLVEDTPDDHIHDLFIQSIWGDEGLGQPVLGKRETVKKFTRQDLINHVMDYYGTEDIVISCAGRFDHQDVLTKLNQYFGSMRRGSTPTLNTPNEFRSGTVVFPKDLSETHICFGVEAIPFASEDRYTLAILNSILGASVSSRLFQEIREKKGYAYAIFSFTSSYVDTGFWAVYAGVGKKKAALVSQMIIKEMRSLYETLTPEELKRAKDQIKGNIILGLESTSSRMQSIARQEIYFGRYFTHQEIIKAVESVTLKQARDLANKLINNSRGCLVALGPVSKDDFSGLV
ncbi:MAG: insulinase family protein [Thermodesulfovibrionales bacterium]|nr:insulinase family protein [Thermodesulfovibrionales bacterium]